MLQLWFTMRVQRLNEVSTSRTLKVQRATGLHCILSKSTFPLQPSLWTLMRVATHWDCDAYVCSDRGLRVTTAAGLQSNFPASRSAHGIGKSHSWLLWGENGLCIVSHRRMYAPGQVDLIFSAKIRKPQTPPPPPPWASHSVKLQTAFPPFHFALFLFHYIPKLICPALATLFLVP